MVNDIEKTEYKWDLNIVLKLHVISKKFNEGRKCTVRYHGAQKTEKKGVTTVCRCELRSIRELCDREWRSVKKCGKK